MILDDDRETLDLLVMILRKQFDVFVESDPQRLLAEDMTYKPDLILIDHFIGDVTSREIINAFRARPDFGNIPIILHSAHAQIESIAQTQNASGFIKKPSSIQEIRSYLEHVLS